MVFSGAESAGRQPCTADYHRTGERNRRLPFAKSSPALPDRKIPAPGTATRYAICHTPMLGTLLVRVLTYLTPALSTIAQVFRRTLYRVS